MTRCIQLRVGKLWLLTACLLGAFLWQASTAIAADKPVKSAVVPSSAAQPPDTSQPAEERAETPEFVRVFDQDGRPQ
ncbi:MAG: hypothetical protein KDA45_17055, partial [Planctomycetales bacterium]|nr:hypothetical protein [Planctomycetales bacterium]